MIGFRYLNSIILNHPHFYDLDNLLKIQSSGFTQDLDNQNLGERSQDFYVRECRVCDRLDTSYVKVPSMVA